METFEEILKAALEEMKLAATEGEMARFRQYYEELVFWNRSIALVSVKSPLDIPVKHLTDSLTVLKFIKKKDARLLDVGAGAGFPGIPLRIMMPSLRLTLVESSRKKASFLKNVKRKLALADIAIVNGRIESMMREIEYRGTFDYVISRATFKLPALIDIGAHFLSPRGTLIAMKGKYIDGKAKNSEDMASEKGLSLTECHDILLPVTGHKRKILLFRRLPIN